MALVFGLWSLPAAQAQNARNWVEIPFDQVLLDTCAGEFVHFTGSAWLDSVSRWDGAGGYHYAFQYRAKLDGVGMTSGKKYAINNSAHQTAHFVASNLNLTSTFTQEWKLISQGSGQNGALRQIVHLTFNAAGDLTASVDNELVDMCLE